MRARVLVRGEHLDPIEWPSATVRVNRRSASRAQFLGHIPRQYSSWRLSQSRFDVVRARAGVFFVCVVSRVG